MRRILAVVLNCRCGNFPEDFLSSSGWVSRHTRSLLYGMEALLRAHKYHMSKSCQADLDARFDSKERTSKQEISIY